MAQIVTITNPLTGQPAQVDQLEHTAQEIDDAIARALPGGAIDIALANKLGGIESTDYPGCYYRMVDGVVEWFNPPMQLGGMDADGNPINEYRTTERYMGKPVYVKLVNFGALPNNMTMYVDPNIPNFEKLIEPMTVTITGSDGAVHDSPLLDDTKILARSWFKMESGGIAIRTMDNRSTYSAVVKLKYTKTTD